MLVAYMIEEKTGNRKKEKSEEKLKNRGTICNFSQVSIVTSNYSVNTLQCYQTVVVDAHTSI